MKKAEKEYADQTRNAKTLAQEVNSAFSRNYNQHLVYTLRDGTVDLDQLASSIRYPYEIVGSYSEHTVIAFYKTKDKQKVTLANMMQAPAPWRAR